MTNVTELVKRPADEILETPTFLTIKRVIDACATRNQMGAIMGPPGIGKTTALERYRYNAGWTLVCTMSSAQTSVSAVLKVLGEVFNCPPERSIHDRYTTLVNSIRWSREDRVLLIDEAQLLNDLCLDMIRSIHDETRLPIVFCGNANFRDRFNNTRDAAFAQFTSRIVIRHNFSGVEDGDLRVLCNHHGITSPQAVKLLKHHADHNGGLRMVVNIIDFAHGMGGGDGALTLGHLKDAVQAMGLSQ